MTEYDPSDFESVEEELERRRNENGYSAVVHLLTDMIEANGEENLDLVRRYLRERHEEQLDFNGYQLSHLERLAKKELEEYGELDPETRKLAEEYQNEINLEFQS